MVTEVVSVMMWNASIQLRRCQVKTVNIYLKRLCAQGFTVKSACHFWPWNVPLHWVGVTPLTLVGGEVSVGVILEAIRASFKHLFKVGIQWLSRVLLCDPTDSSMPGFPALLYLQEFVQLMPAELMMPSNHLFLFCPLLLQPSIFPRIRVFFNELTFPMGDQTIEASASASVLPMNIQNWFPLGLTGLISLLSKRLKISPAPQFESIHSLVLRPLYGPTLFVIHYWSGLSFPPPGDLPNSDQTHVSCVTYIGGRFFATSTTSESQW